MEPSPVLVRTRVGFIGKRRRPDFWKEGIDSRADDSGKLMLYEKDIFDKHLDSDFNTYKAEWTTGS